MKYNLIPFLLTALATAYRKHKWAGGNHGGRRNGSWGGKSYKTGGNYYSHSSYHGGFGAPISGIFYVVGLMMGFVVLYCVCVGCAKFLSTNDTEDISKENRKRRKEPEFKSQESSEYSSTVTNTDSNFIQPPGPLLSKE